MSIIGLVSVAALVYWHIDLIDRTRSLEYFFLDNWFNFQNLVGSVLLIFLVFCRCPIMCPLFWFPCCDVRYELRIKTTFGSSLPPVVCRMPMSYLRYLCLLAHRGVQHILHCVFVWFLSSSWLPVASFSGWFISDCLFDILWRLFIIFSSFLQPSLICFVQRIMPIVDSLGLFSLIVTADSNINSVYSLNDTCLGWDRSMTGKKRMSRDDRNNWISTSGARSAYKNPAYEIHLCTICIVYGAEIDGL